MADDEAVVCALVEAAPGLVGYGDILEGDARLEGELGEGCDVLIDKGGERIGGSWEREWVMAMWVGSYLWRSRRLNALLVDDEVGLGIGEGRERC
jgi:hypothetical protein